MRIPSVPNDGLDIGEKYHMYEIEATFGSGGFTSGINPRIDENDDLEYILLTSSGDSRYQDHLRGGRIRYIGQDHGDGDQPKSGRNGRLISQKEDLTIPIYSVGRARAKSGNTRG